MTEKKSAHLDMHDKSHDTLIEIKGLKTFFFP